MLNKEEFEILNNYPLYHFINIEDYVIDFVIKNPQNYPITSTIIAHANIKNIDVKNATLRDVYDRHSICKSYNSFKKRVDSPFRIEDCKNFTSAMIMFDARRNEFDYYSAKFAILKKINDGRDFIIICRSDALNYFYIFDTNYDMGLICIDNNDYPLFASNYFDKTIDYDNLPCDSFKFFTKLDDDQGTKEDYFTRYEMMMRYITGVAAAYIKNQTNFTPIQLGETRHSLIYLMQNNNSSYCKNMYIDRYLVKTEKKEQIVNHPEFSSSDPLFDKKIDTEYVY